MSHAHRLLVAAVCLSALGAVASAHDDDPKILDRRAPYAGPGYRNANLSQPGRLGLGGSPFVSSGVNLMSWIPLGDMGSPATGADCWGYVSPSGREYALIGHELGTTVVEVSVPSNAQVIATLPGPASLWRDTKVFGDHAYSVSEGGDGVQVFSLAQVDSGTVTQVGTITAGGTTKSHNVAINEDSGFLYRLGGDQYGLRVYDLNVSAVNPPLVATWATRYIHDAQIVSYTSGPYAGKEIAFACSGYNSGWVSTGLDILDVTDKSNIQVLANITYSGAVYSHQGWLSPDRQYFYLGDELDENGSFPTTTHVVDVSDLSNPQVLTSFTNGNQSVGHNLYTKDNLIFEANYRSGLRIFDASNPLAPVETAYFDTFPDNDANGYNGLWSVYPYLPSGVVLGSDMERGLFVWTVGAPSVTISLPSAELTLVDPAGDVMPVTITEAQPGELVAGSAMLHTNDGSGWVSTPLSALGGDNYQANFPAAACGTTLDYYLTADATSGTTSSLPAGAPFSLFTASVALGRQVLGGDDLENTSGWTMGLASDTATTGTWTLVDPRGTAAQPEDDHTAAGTLCFVTGQGSKGGSLGENDVDGGVTTLVTPAYDLSSASSPSISYWRWFSNDQGAGPGEDILEVEISGDGVNWSSVETVGPTSSESSGGWFQHSFFVSDFIALSSTVQLRFRASDLGAGSIVEAAIDDLEVVDLDCGAGCGASNYCAGLPNSSGPGALMSLSGSTSLSANDLTLQVTGASVSQPGLFYYGTTQIASAFGDGLRCVGGSSYRLNPMQFTDASGQTTRAINYASPPTGSGTGLIQAGDTWYFQYWFRDPAAGGFGFNLSDGLELVFCP